MEDLYVEYDEFVATRNGEVDAFVKSKIKVSIERLLGKAGQENVNLGDIYITIPTSEMDKEDCEKISESLSCALCSTINKATENLQKLSHSGSLFNSCAKGMLNDTVKKCRNDIGKDENILEDEKKSIVKRICKWILELSWIETIKNVSSMEKNDDVIRDTSLENVELPNGVVDITNQVVDFLNTASAYNAVISSGAILKQIVGNLDSEIDGQKHANIPNVVREAFETDILSKEESVLKKLVALERFLIGLENFGWGGVLTPIAVVRIAQDAFVYVNDVKASYKRVLMVQDVATAKEVL